MNKSAITLAYIDEHPGSAAADLAALNPNDAAAFLETTPLRYAVKVINFTSSWAGAAMLRHVSATTSAGVLREAPFAKAVEILRLLPSDHRDEVLKATPRRLQRDFELSLSYPGDTVGAAMAVETFAVRPDRLVQDILTELKSNQDVAGDVVFVVAEDHEFLGAVNVLDIIRAPNGATIAHIMSTNIATLSARSRLASVADLDAWDEYSHLPVLSRRDRLVGILSRRHLSQSLETVDPFDDRPSVSILGAVAGTFVYSGVEFAKLMADNKSPKRRTQKRGTAQ